MRDRHSAFGRLERLILSAANFVQPSYDLRPRTVEAAREYCRDKRAEQRLGGFVLAVMLVLIISSPAMQYVDVLRTQSTGPSATEMEQIAIEYSERREIGSHFGLSEAFSQLRQFQADRLGNSIYKLR